MRLLACEDVHRLALCLAAAAALAPAARAYSVLTHEAIIDSAWDRGIQPLLLRRFPQAAEADLRRARSYAYAGAIVQDMGYYPFGSRLFSDLVHYVRSGDYIVNLIREARTLDEYAFALGALDHYAADSLGHSIAVNRAVPLQFAKLRRKFGDVVTYEDNPTAHMRVEFGFDVTEMAAGAYAPEAYHDFIGFRVAQDLLERAFRDTYGLSLQDIFANLDIAIGTYRRAVSTFIPALTRAAWAWKKDEIARTRPGAARRDFVYRLSRADYRKEWGSERPKIGVNLLAVFLSVLPKIGPLRILAFKRPTPETERMFQQSFARTLETYRSLLREHEAGTLHLPDRDFDTGNPTRPGEYRMADNAWAALAIKLADRAPAAVDPAVRRSVLAFFGDLSLPYATKEDGGKWKKTVAAVEKLRASGTTASPAAAPAPSGR